MVPSVASEKSRVVESPQIVDVPLEVYGSLLVVVSGYSVGLSVLTEVTGSLVMVEVGYSVGLSVETGSLVVEVGYTVGSVFSEVFMLVDVLLVPSVVDPVT